MKIAGQLEVSAVDGCLDILEDAAFRAELWQHLPKAERERLVWRLKAILASAEPPEAHCPRSGPLFFVHDHSAKEM